MSAVLGVIVWCYNTTAMLIISLNTVVYFSHTLHCCQKCVPGKQACVAMRSMFANPCLELMNCSSPSWENMESCAYPVTVRTIFVAGNSRVLVGKHGDFGDWHEGPHVSHQRAPVHILPSPHQRACFHWAAATRHEALPYMVDTCHRPSVADWVLGGGGYGGDLQVVFLPSPFRSTLRCCSSLAPNAPGPFSKAGAVKPKITETVKNNFTLWVSQFPQHILRKKGKSDLFRTVQNTS